MPTANDVKSFVGRLNPFQPKARPPAQVDPSAIDATSSTEVTTGKMTFADLTPEDLMRRSYAILAEVNHDPPFHDQVLNFIKEAWRIIGPIAFVVFTAGEVFYYLKHFLASDNNFWTSVLLWGVTLLIELPFMIATFDLSGRKKRAIEAREAGKRIRDKDTTGAVIAWVLMAVVNVTGQVAFLVFVTHVASLQGQDTTWLYFFIIIRVLGVLLGDAYTAFFLSPPETTISRVLRMQKAQQEGVKVLSEAAMDRQREESSLRLEMQRNQNTIDRERSETAFVKQFADMNMANALRQQQRFLNVQGGAPHKLIEGPEPETGAL